jgi:hypothetical protein
VHSGLVETISKVYDTPNFSLGAVREDVVDTAERESVAFGGSIEGVVVIYPSREY